MLLPITTFHHLLCDKPIPSSPRTNLFSSNSSARSDPTMARCQLYYGCSRQPHKSRWDEQWQKTQIFNGTQVNVQWGSCDSKRFTMVYLQALVGHRPVFFSAFQLFCPFLSLTSQFLFESPLNSFGVPLLLFHWRHGAMISCQTKRGWWMRWMACSNHFMHLAYIQSYAVYVHLCYIIIYIYYNIIYIYMVHVMSYLWRGTSTVYLNTYIIFISSNGTSEVDLGKQKAALNWSFGASRHMDRRCPAFLHQLQGILRKGQLTCRWGQMLSQQWLEVIWLQELTELWSWNTLGHTTCQHPKWLNRSKQW